MGGKEVVEYVNGVWEKKYNEAIKGEPYPMKSWKQIYEVAFKDGVLWYHENKDTIELLRNIKVKDK